MGGSLLKKYFLEFGIFQSNRKNILCYAVSNLRPPTFLISDHPGGLKCTTVREGYTFFNKNEYLLNFPKLLKIPSTVWLSLGIEEGKLKLIKLRNNLR